MYTVNPSDDRRTASPKAHTLLATRIATIAFVSATALAAGCASFERNHYIAGSVPDDYRTRHPIIVSQSETVEDIVVPPSASRLSYRDQAVAQSFASRFKQSGSGQMAILVPSGSANEIAARRLAGQIVAVIAERGVDRERISIEAYSAAGHGDAATIRLVYAGITASVESECGQWNEDVLDTGQNRNYANFGCASQKNLAAMVANPADFLGPRGESEIDATRRTTVINDWREDGSGGLPDLF